MFIPVILFLFSLAAALAALALPGLTDLLLVAVPSGLASLWLIFRTWRRHRYPPPSIIVDGSNVMHWQDDTARIAPVREVVRRLEAAGYRTGVVFDANAGHLLEGRYRHDGAMARKLGLPAERVMVVDKGSPADPTILQAASDMQARVVSNDRFRDWADRFPQVRSPGFLIRGGYRKGKLCLDLDPKAKARPFAPPAEA